MKKLLFVILVAVSFQTQAQFDDRFYYPTAEWQHQFEDFQHRVFTLSVGTDTLHNVLLIPEESNGITVLYFHGSGYNVTFYSQFVAPMVEAGYQVYMVDFRGYGKSTGTPLHTNVAADAPVVLARVKALPQVQDQTLWVYGTSLGSQVAAHLTRQHASEIDALVLDGPMASFTDIAATTAPAEQQDMIRQYVTSPYAAKEDVKYLEETPLLVIGSEEDSSVPFAQIQEVYDQATGPKLLWVYEGEHLQGPVLDTEAFLQQLEALYALSADAQK